MKSKTKIDLGLLIVLVVFGVLGRWLQPTWFFTPTAAVGLFAGYYFSRRWLALAAPLCVMLISDLVLPAYGNAAVLVAVYAALALPVVLGWQLRKNPSYGRLALCGLLPSVVFYLTTNFAVWATLGWYPPTAAGLLQCYAAALPFFRWMLTGDVLYTATLFGAYVFATQQGYLPAINPQPQPAPALR